MKQILEKVLARVVEDGIEAHIENVNGAETLRLLPGDLGPAEDSKVVMEICKIPMKDIDDCGYYQFYTMLEADLDKEIYPKLFAALNELNMTTILGNYAVLTEERVLYHKAALRLPTMDDDALAENLLGMAYDCLAIIDYDVPALLEILKK